MAVEGSVPLNGVIVPHLVVADAAAAMDFYAKAFGAQVLYRSPSPSDEGEHIHFKIWSSLIQVSTEQPNQSRSKMEGSLLASPPTLGGSTCLFQIGVPDVDAAYSQAVENGALPALSPTDMFKEELGGHVIARHSKTDACKGPADFDCDHGDLLYAYQEAPGQPLKAIYLDNEGHVIHYVVSLYRPPALLSSYLTLPCQERIFGSPMS